METNPFRNKSVPCKLMLDSEYSVIKSDVIKSFDCSIQRVNYSFSALCKANFRRIVLYVLHSQA